MLRTSGVTLDQNDALIKFNSVTGKNYEILRTGNLASGIWTGGGIKPAVTVERTQLLIVELQVSQLASIA